MSSEQSKAKHGSSIRPSALPCLVRTCPTCTRSSNSTVCIVYLFCVLCFPFYIPPWVLKRTTVWWISCDTWRCCWRMFWFRSYRIVILMFTHTHCCSNCINCVADCENGVLIWRTIMIMGWSCVTMISWENCHLDATTLHWAWGCVIHPSARDQLHQQPTLAAQDTASSSSLLENVSADANGRHLPSSDGDWAACGHQYDPTPLPNLDAWPTKLQP